MKSIKPGRGPSAMGAVGSIFAAIFGVFWTIMASSMGAPIFFTLFGIMFIVVAIIQGIYNFNNATKRNRMSIYDITEENEEPDPFQNFIATKDKEIESNDVSFCPYCGTSLHEGYNFCPKCGKKAFGENV